MTEIYHSVIGLPRSGKTTFLAALWHLIDAGEVQTKIVLDKLVGDHGYLNSIVDSWRRCEEVPRTSMAGETQVAIRVHETDSRRQFVLCFPDLSGESYEQMLAARKCKPDYVESYNGPGGLLLFVTANRALDGICITDISNFTGEPASSSEPAQVVEWSPTMVPEQVRVVELLQFLQQRPFERRRRKLGLMVSAWDVVEAPSLSPAEWLARELPLLHQFLQSNAGSFDVRVYGVSAQGGDVRGERKQELLRITPSERIRCVYGDVDSHDITEPISWLMTE